MLIAVISFMGGVFLGLIMMALLAISKENTIDEQFQENRSEKERNK